MGFGKTLFAALAVMLMSLYVQPAEALEEEAAALLPGADEIQGWSPDGEPLLYSSEDLWEYINGSADKFVSYDLRKAVVQRYIGKNEEELKIEIYRHGSPKMAYGIYSQFSYGKKPEDTVGDRSFAGKFSLHFWKGIYYVKVSVFEDTEELGEAMTSFARAVASAIKEGGNPPYGIDIFARKYLVPFSVTYVAEGVLGSSGLPPALTAEYRKGDATGKLYLFPFDEEEEAVSMFRRYVEKIGAEMESGKGKGGEYLRAAGEIPYRGRIVVFSSGRISGILTGFAQSEEAVQEIITETADRASAED